MESPAFTVSTTLPERAHGGFAVPAGNRRRPQVKAFQPVPSGSAGHPGPGATQTGDPYGLAHPAARRAPTVTGAPSQLNRSPALRQNTLAGDPTTGSHSWTVKSAMTPSDVKWVL